MLTIHAQAPSRCRSFPRGQDSEGCRGFRWQPRSLTHFVYTVYTSAAGLESLYSWFFSLSGKCGLWRDSKGGCLAQHRGPEAAEERGSAGGRDIKRRISCPEVTGRPAVWGLSGATGIGTIGHNQPRLVPGAHACGHLRRQIRREGRIVSRLGTG